MEKIMKRHYTALIGLAFLFTGTTAFAQDDTQAKINTILETLAAQEEVIQNHLEKISVLEKKNAELNVRITAAQSTANAAQSTANAAQTTANAAQTTANAAQTTANAAQTTANAAQTTANTAVSKADGAQDTANKANKKYCYITGSGFAQDFLECPYGGTYKGAIDFYNTKIAITGINQQQRWIDSRHFWLCCL
jgi:hypothetical protein